MRRCTLQMVHALRAATMLCALLVCVARFASAPMTAAHSHQSSDSAGSIAGTVVNGTHANAPVASQAVVLQAVLHGSPHDVATTTSDAGGHFSFSGLDTTDATTYAVYAQFQGGLFPSAAVSFANGAAQQVTLTVYDVTTSDAALHVGVANVLVSPLTPTDQRRGWIPVGEFLTFVNSGKTAYVGSVTPANGKPMNLLRFALPPDATNLTLGAGFAGAQTVQVGTGFGANATVLPGTTQFAFAFDAPYTATRYTFPYKAEYPTDRVAVLVASSIQVTPRDFTAEPDLTAVNTTYHALRRDHLAASQSVTYGLRGLPLPGEDPVLDPQTLAIIGAGLALVLGLLLALYLRRGALAVALRLIPASALVATGAARSTGANHDAERKRLLQTLLTLEQRHNAGTLDDASYRRQRDANRAELRAVLAASLPSARPQRGTQAATVSATTTSAALPTDTITTPASTPNAQGATTGRHTAPTAPGGSR